MSTDEKINDGAGTSRAPTNLSATELATALASALTGQQVAGVSARRFPSFGRAFPNIWFAQIEHIFRVARVTSERTMYSELVSQMEPSVLASVGDIFLLPEEQQTYSNLKRLLMKQYSESESERLQRLLQDQVLDDKKPSDLLREMRNLAQGKLEENILRHLWEQRLPQTVRMILTSNNGSLAQVAEQADQLLAITPHSNISAVSTPAATISAVSKETAANQEAMRELTRMVKDLARTVAGLKNEKRSRTRERSNSRDRSRNNKSRPHGETCFYHKKFGAAATKCKSPCSFPNSGN